MNIKLLPLLGALALGACAQGTQIVSRAQTNDLSFAESQQTQIHTQAAALNATADKLVMASTLKGAAIGALVGCGLTAVTGAGAEKCVTGAAIGAVGGGVIGNAKGKRDVARRIRIADPNKLVRTVRAANDHMDEVRLTLPGYLATQDIELARLERALADKSISKAEHDAGVNVIRQDRARLAESLSLTYAQAKTAAQNLEAAASRGQTGLEWHIIAASDIAKNATSARSSIQLL